MCLRTIEINAIFIQKSHTIEVDLKTSEIRAILFLSESTYAVVGPSDLSALFRTKRYQLGGNAGVNRICVIVFTVL